MTDEERFAAHLARRGPGRNKAKVVEAAKSFRQQVIGADRFNDTILREWEEAFKPGGSGPTGLTKMIRALIEEVQDLRAERLPRPALDKLPRAVYGSREDVLARCAFLNVGFLRSPSSGSRFPGRRDAVADELSKRIEELSRLAAVRSEGEVLYIGMTSGYRFTKSIPAECLTDEANERYAWFVERQEAPFGCYHTEPGKKRDFVRLWTGRTPTEALTKAMTQLAAADADQP